MAFSKELYLTMILLRLQSQNVESNFARWFSIGYYSYQIPSKITMNVGGQNIELKVKSMQINAKLKEKDFVWEE